RLVGPGDDPTPVVTPTGTETTEPDDPATDEPDDPATDEPDDPATDEPDDPATDEPDGPTGDAVDVAHGVSIVPADGWDEVDRGDGYVVLYDGVSTFYGEAFFLSSSSGAADEAEAYLSWLAEDSTDAQLGEPTALDVGSGAESVAQSASWTVSDSSGSYLLQFTTVATIRESDNLMSLATVFFYPDHTDVEQLTDDFGLMADSVISSTIAGG